MNHDAWPRLLPVPDPMKPGGLENPGPKGADKGPGDTQTATVNTQ